MTYWWYFNPYRRWLFWKVHKVKFYWSRVTNYLKHRRGSETVGYFTKDSITYENRRIYGLDGCPTFRVDRLFTKLEACPWCGNLQDP